MNVCNLYYISVLSVLKIFYSCLRDDFKANISTIIFFILNIHCNIVEILYGIILLFLCLEESFWFIFFSTLYTENDISMVGVLITRMALLVQCVFQWFD